MNRGPSGTVLTGRQRGRVFGYDRYLQILNEGTTSPPDRG
jgi:hypothetical protein